MFRHYSYNLMLCVIYSTLVRTIPLILRWPKERGTMTCLKFPTTANCGKEKLYKGCLKKEWRQEVNFHAVLQWVSREQE